jgi:hypothetical protein
VHYVCFMCVDGQYLDTGGAWAPGEGHYQLFFFWGTST